MALEEANTLRKQLHEKEKQHCLTEAALNRFQARCRQIHDDILEMLEEQQENGWVLNGEEQEDQHNLKVDQTVTVASAMVQNSKGPDDVMNVSANHQLCDMPLRALQYNPVDLPCVFTIRLFEQVHWPRLVSVGSSCGCPEIPHLQEITIEQERRPVEETGPPLISDAGAQKLAFPQGHTVYDDIPFATSKHDSSHVQKTTTEHEHRYVQETGPPVVLDAEKLVLPRGHIADGDFPLGTSKCDLTLYVSLSGVCDPSVHNGNCGNMDLMTVLNTANRSSLC